MICLRCGYCCMHSGVVVVKDPELGMAKDNLMFVSNGTPPCPHLQGDKVGEYSCAIHDYPWYKKTPCFTHGQIEWSKDSLCRMGEFLTSKK